MCRAAGQDVTKVDPQHYKVIFENSHIRVIEGRDKPGDTTPMHHHPAYISYVDGPVKAKVTLTNGESFVSGPSDEVWCSPPTTHSTENVGTTNTHEILVEFKDFNPCDENKSSATAAPKTERINGAAAQRTDSALIEMITKNEKDIFEAIKTRDKKKYADFMANDMTVVSAEEGIFNKEVALKGFDSESLSAYSLSDVKGVLVTPQTALLTYKLWLKTSLAGKPHEGDFLVSSLWVNREGVWRNVLYQETPSK